MNAFTDGLKLTTDSIGGVAAGIGKGLQSIEHGLKLDSKEGSKEEQASDTKEDTRDTKSEHTSTLEHGLQSDIKEDTKLEPTQPPSAPAAPASLFTTLTSGATTLLAPTTYVAKSGASLARDATSAGLSIGSKVAHSGLDISVNVATGTASLAGTALGGVVAAAAETSGVVFQPVGSGLKALEGLDRLGEQGVQAINGLSLGAVRKVSEMTTKALNMSGKTPTFFDPDADGIVCVSDTIRGLVLLGLDEKNASYAAYALHTVFSYSTSDSWIPSVNTSLPIHVDKMANTRWGKNWGNFERFEWVDDVEIDKFFVPQKEQKQLSDYWKEGRQGFGILLIIFEWGTTWPFYIPPVPVHQIPFANDIGSVVRKAILPTIVSNFKKSRAANPVAQNPPPAKAPEDPINMPGEFTG